MAQVTKILHGRPKRFSGLRGQVGRMLGFR
jgi:hypothetical protein